MSLKEALENIRKRIDELTRDVHETMEATHSLVKTARPKPLRALLEKRMEDIRPLRRLRKNREEK